MADQNKDLGVSIKSQKLLGKRVAFCVCGGIGAVQTVKLIRELRRHGADVTPFLTPQVSLFITPLSVGWAAGKPAHSDVGQDVEHLDPFDLVVVAPATLNTIAKAALGLADNVVTLIIASQLGRKGAILFVPAMNLQLQSHPSYAGHKSRLSDWGVRFFECPPEEGRLKMPTPEALIESIERILL